MNKVYDELDYDFSIVTLTYNRKEFLRKTIESVQIHTPYPHEMIIVDNGSTDGTQEMVKSDYSFFCKLIELEGNQGAWVREYGYEMATGKYIVNLDDDCLAVNMWINTMLQYMSLGIACVAPQCFVFTGWDNPADGDDPGIGGLADFFTGYVFMMRNLKGFRYNDKRFGYWDDDLQLSMVIKEKGWEIRKCKMCCQHLAQRGEVNWNERNRGLELIKDNWMMKPNLNFTNFDQKSFVQSKRSN